MLFILRIKKLISFREIWPFLVLSSSRLGLGLVYLGCSGINTSKTLGLVIKHFIELVYMQRRYSLRS